MIASISALNTLSLTEQAASIYIERMNRLHSIGELFFLAIVFAIVFTGFVYTVKFFVFLGRSIYKILKERGTRND